MSQSQRLVLVLGLNLALVAALVIVGVAAHSLGVLAAGGGYLRNLEGQRGKPGRWVVGDPLPTEDDLLPDPAQLDNRCTPQATG